MERGYLELAFEYIKEEKVLEVKHNSHLLDLMNSLSDEIPESMKMTMAMYAMATFVGHFHVKIDLGKDNKVPINIIAIVLAHSGAKKSSSIDALERAMAPGYEHIMAIRKLERAIKAKDAGIGISDLAPLNPLFNLISTVPGLVQRLNEFKREGIGMPSLFVDELVTALETNIDLIPNFEMIAQLFDSGNLKVKVLKDKERQSEEVKGMGMSALFIGTEHVLLNDPDLLKIMRKYLVSMMARRSFVCYPQFKKKKRTAPDFETMVERISKEKDKLEDSSIYAGEQSLLIAKKYEKAEDRIPVVISKDLKDLIIAYEIMGDELSNDLEIDEEVLEQKHRHWKVLKLAAMFTVYDCRDEISRRDYSEAIKVAEQLDGELMKFINRANNEPFEKIAIMFKEGLKSLPFTQILKNKWAKKISDIDDLIILSNSELDGLSYIEQNGSSLVLVEPKEVTDFSYSITSTYNLKEVTEAFMERDGLTELNTEEDFAKFKILKREAKTLIARECALEGYQLVKGDSLELAKVLTNDCAFTPFALKDNTKEGGGDRTIGSADFIVLDVDNGDQRIEHMCDLLDDFQYIAALTSDKENPYKYRIIIPSDIEIDVGRAEWLELQRGVAEELGIEVDAIGKASIFFGYADREVYMNEEGERFPISEVIKKIRTDAEVKKSLSSNGAVGKFDGEPPASGDITWSKRRSIFNYAYALTTEGDSGYHTKLFRAMKHGWRFKLNREQNIDLLDDIIENSGREPRDGWKKTLDYQRDKLYEEGE